MMWITRRCSARLDPRPAAAETEHAGGMRAVIAVISKPPSQANVEGSRRRYDVALVAHVRVVELDRRRRDPPNRWRPPPTRRDRTAAAAAIPSASCSACRSSRSGRTTAASCGELDGRKRNATSPYAPNSCSAMFGSMPGQASHRIVERAGAVDEHVRELTACFNPPARKAPVEFVEADRRLDAAAH